MTRSIYNVSTDVLSEFVFNSNHIEGYSPSDYPKTSRLYKAHMKAAQMVVREAIWEPTVLHMALLDGTDMLPAYEVGTYRRVQVYIGDFYPPSPGRHLLDHVERWRNMVLDGPNSWADTEGWAWQVHDEFECCHPFTDGNGRTGRLILNAMRLKYDLPWLTIHHGDEQQAYYRHIRDFQRSGAWKCS